MICLPFTKVDCSQPTTESVTKARRKAKILAIILYLIPIRLTGRKSSTTIRLLYLGISGRNEELHPKGTLRLVKNLFTKAKI